MICILPTVVCCLLFVVVVVVVVAHLVLAEGAVNGSRGQFCLHSPRDDCEAFLGQQFYGQWLPVSVAVFDVLHPFASLHSIYTTSLGTNSANLT